ncbi:amidoligase family protein [Palleronia sp. LCG004]|uniref:amidoligase family protein n=1 Tax=Palleronia sp. LCG004 TaxID=3079304 RepID=UPI002942E791|nr:amidoligase family protein [Palleronia sp. LCG004]WOI56010.1 amidoligase family protein [Palleronia sp. LCG004]
MSGQQNRLSEYETRDGLLRRVGIEVEFAGMTERDVAHLVAQTLGGTPNQTSDYEWEIEQTALGRIEVLLDTALRDWSDSGAKRIGLDIGRAVIPVEYITEPLRPARFADLERLNAALAGAGAIGTQNGIALGFGVHLNVALTGTNISDILPVVQAFALIEDWLRSEMGIDPARRILPFVNPYPADLVDALASPEADGWSIDDLLKVYLEHAPSRNHALDLLPILKHLDEDAVVDAVPEMAQKSARPAWHYRLPDCRIDDPDWSISLEWSRWCAVERVAADHELLGSLREAWRDYRRHLHVPGGWASTSGDVIRSSGVFP